MRSAAAILDTVKAVLEGREKNYDNPKPNFDRIAAYWNTLLEAKLTAPLTASDVALMMILMKVAREQYKHTDDNLLDAIGYAVCGLRIAEVDNVERNSGKT
jgi:hypothetical protein